jgi:hypothetical protein
MSRSGRALVIVALATASMIGGCEGKGTAQAVDAAVMLASHPDAAIEGGTASVADGGVLEDTAMPAATGEDLQTRMRHLLEALAQNNPDLAGDALFPRDGYVTVKDSADPQKAWDKKVSGSFRRSIERMHKRMKGIEHAKFVSFEIGHSVVQLTPKKKDFKKPLWRVKHSKLSFTIDGKARHIDIAEMTAWRGAWYVTRLR